MADESNHSARGSSRARELSSQPPASTPANTRLLWGLYAVCALLVCKRIAYHYAYLAHDPFALATFSDGELYEQAARDLLAHPPLGEKPFYLQGLYAAFLALPMAFHPSVVAGLLFQLAVSALGLLLFQRAALHAFGQVPAALSLCVLLAAPEPMFYENKYLSVGLGITLNILLLYCALRAFERLTPGALMLAGIAAGLAWLGRPNLVLALPFLAFGIAIAARAQALSVTRTLMPFALGVLLAIAPMALRNQIVVGAPHINPSHGGGIPFFIGHNPYANGRWNSAGGLVTGMVYTERSELAKKLGIDPKDPRGVDRAVGETLYARAFDFIRENPGRTARITWQKLWLMTGNDRLVRDYDVRGERELLGAFHQLGIPFGVVLGLGGLGLWSLFSRALAVRKERAASLALVCAVGGQLFAVLAANLIVFTSAQNRVPLYVPLAFVAGPALLAVFSRLKREVGSRFPASNVALACALCVGAQAFWPRLPEIRVPSSVHYYNLGAVEERLGRLEEAAAHLARAVERNKLQPIYKLSLARTLRKLGRCDEALELLDPFARMPNISPEMQAAARYERGRCVLGEHDAPDKPPSPPTP